jgi:hypothetical protein
MPVFATGGFCQGVRFRALARTTITKAKAAVPRSSGTEESGLEVTNGV